MNAREEILDRLRKQQKPKAVLAPWSSPVQIEDLAAQFAAALSDAGGEVRTASSLKAALGEIGYVLEDIKARHGLVNDQQPFSQALLSERWPNVNWRLVGQIDGELRSFAASADIGISVADVALGETGSVLVSSGPGRSRLTNLLPPVHLALVPASSLAADLFAWASSIQAPLPASLTLISGPSKTGDIEQTMAVGVHGPGRFIAVLYDDG
jgi:L-lactate utilization protein LutC